MYTSEARIFGALSATKACGGDIFIGDIRIGSYVTHGDKNRKTVYASRIYLPGKRIAVDGYTKSSMLRKVAKELNQAIKHGDFSMEHLL